MLQAARKFFGIDKIDLRSFGKDGSEFTPDLWKLEQHEYQLLFVPDVFMSRHRGFAILEETAYERKPIATAFTADNFWGFWKHKLGADSYAVPLVNQRKDNTWYNACGRIKGELLAIRPRAFIDLDIYYQNRLEFLRFRNNIIIPYKKKTYARIGELVSDDYTHMVRAWMYMGIRSYWEPLLDGGYTFCPVTSFEPPLREGRWHPGRYFYWSLNEYKDN